MSVTTWKTTSPSWIAKASRAVLCKKGIKLAAEDEPDPELEAGIGAGLTAHEVIERRKLKAIDSDTVSVKSMMSGKKKGRVKNLKNDAAASGMLLEAKKIKEKRLLKEGKTDDHKNVLRKVLDEEDDLNDEKEKKWLLGAFQEDEEDDSPDKTVDNILKGDDDDEDDEDDVKDKMKDETSMPPTKPSNGKSNINLDTTYRTAEERAEAKLALMEMEEAENEKGGMRSGSLKSKANSSSKPSDGGSSQRIVRRPVDVDDESDEGDFGVNLPPENSRDNRASGASTDDEFNWLVNQAREAT